MAQFDEIVSEELERYGRKGLKAELSVEALRVPLGTLEAMKPTTIPLGSSVEEAVQMINKPGVSCVVVTTEDGKLHGLVTERDLCTRVLSRGLDPKTTRIDEIMTRAPVTLRTDDPLTFALAQMDVGGYRHIPLVDENHRPVGIVTARRVINHIVEFFPEEVRVLPPSPLHTRPMEQHGG